LFCNITFDGLGGDSDSGDEISIRPETVCTPVMLLQYGKLFFDLTGCISLDEANY
jgi:hypothetical protein